MVRIPPASALASIVDINELAYVTGAHPGAIRRAGAALFDSLSGRDPDLSKALIAATNASGVEPRHVIAMIHVLADQFRGVPEQSDDNDPPDGSQRRPALLERIGKRRNNRNRSDGERHG